MCAASTTSPTPAHIHSYRPLPGHLVCRFTCYDLHVEDTELILDLPNFVDDRADVRVLVQEHLTGAERERPGEREGKRQSDRKTERQTERQTDRQTDRERQRQRQRQRDRETETVTERDVCF